MYRILPVLLLLCCVNIQAQQTAIDSLKIALENTSDYHEQININRNIGFIFLDNQIHYDSAFYYARRGYVIAKKHNLTLRQAQTLFDQAMVLERLDDYSKAIEYYQQSLKFSKQVDTKNAQQGVLITYNNLGDLFSKLGDVENAIKYHELVIEGASNAGFPSLMAANLSNMGEIHFKEGQLDLALKTMRQAKDLMVEIEMNEPLILLSLAELHLARGDTDKAIAEAKESLEMANRVRELEQIYLANVFLSDRFSEKEDYQAANVHLSTAMVYKDSIGYNQGLDQVEKIELKFKIKEQETALTNLQEKTKYRYTIYILAGIGVILLGILIMRQVKIIRMTENIHEIQNSLVKSELERRKMTPTSFQVTQKGDRELKDRV